MAKEDKDKMDMQEIMEVYKKVGTPGPPHKLLASLEGVWTTSTKSWMEPGKPPVETTGTCEQKMVLVTLPAAGVCRRHDGRTVRGVSLLGFTTITGSMCRSGSTR
jgi:hypothetical protein